MGQRHQQFIKTLNPFKHGYHPEGFDLFNKRSKTVMLPFHNQWLYGRSAPLAALRVLEHVQALPKKSRMGDKDTYSSDVSPFGAGGIQHHSFRLFEKWISAIEFILNFSPKGEYNVVMPGMGGSFFLERGDKEYYNLMSKDFTMGDNNDGVTIIDTINMKYCFMNVNYYGYDDITQSSSDLPYLEPVGALEYMNAYYPIDPDKFSEYYMEEWDLNKRKERALENSELNTEIAERFYPFEVLSIDEVRKMFPKVYKQKILIR